MKNIDKIRQMNSEELAEFVIYKLGCDCRMCIAKLYCNEVYNGKIACENIIRQWLEQEVEE